MNTDTRYVKDDEIQECPLLREWDWADEDWSWNDPMLVAA